ncbi:MAG: ABC transporter ATP-binding protein [Desulfovibrionaceae bacterium]|nr:ABC transporter ATP-binding protein [Desulfovibrionaceae bacterium]
MASVELRNIKKHYGKTSVLKGVSLSVQDGEFLTLVGPSGCGKSTLLRIIAGLEDADGGEVRINGKNVAGVRPKDRNVAKVFQSYALYPHLTAFDNIATPLRMRWLTSIQRFPLLGRLLPETRRIERDIRGEVEQVAAMLRMSALLDRKPGQLSGGQRQRVALGRAMVRHPAVFLMDEPLSNLDARHRVQMRAEIMGLHRQLGTTFIYVTHDQAEAMTMSDRVAVMMEGELMQISEPEQLYIDPDDLRVAEMIGTPQINVVAIEKMAQHAGLYLAFPPDAATMAFRPECATIGKPLDAMLNGIVSMTEHLGADIFVHIKLDDDAGTVIVRTKPDAARHEDGAPVGVNVDRHNVLWFDADRKRIRRQAVKKIAA